MSVLFALKWWWHVSWRIPLTRFIHGARRRWPSPDPQMLLPWICSSPILLTVPIYHPLTSIFFLPPEGCGRQRTEAQRVWRTSTLQQKVLVTDIQRVTQRWKNCGDNEGQFVKNNLSFINNLPMTYVNCIIILIFMNPCIVGDSVEIPTRCSFVIEAANTV